MWLVERLADWQRCLQEIDETHPGDEVEAKRLCELSLVIGVRVEDTRARPVDEGEGNPEGTV